MKYRVEIDGNAFEVEIDADAIRVDGEIVDARLIATEGRGDAVLRFGHRQFRFTMHMGHGRMARQGKLFADGNSFDVVVESARANRLRALTLSQDATRRAAHVIAPMPGMVVKVHVAPGDRVAAGQAVLAIEAMKMENELRAAADGVVAAVHAVAGRAVEKGTLLVEIQ